MPRRFAFLCSFSFSDSGQHIHSIDLGFRQAVGNSCGIPGPETVLLGADQSLTQQGAVNRARYCRDAMSGRLAFA